MTEQLQISRPVGRPRVLSQEQEAELVRLRAADTPWKELQARFGLGRTQLFEAWRRACGRDSAVTISEHLS